MEVYDHSIGNEAFYYAFGAYCTESIINTWTTGLKDGPSEVRQFELSDVIVTDSGILQSFVGFDTSKSRILLSFRGSSNLDNWLDTNFGTLHAHIAHMNEHLFVFLFQTWLWIHTQMHRKYQIHRFILVFTMHSRIWKQAD